MSNLKKNLRMILKFDTGADGFKQMIYVLAGLALMVLIMGTYFLFFEFHSIVPNKQ